MPMVYIYKNKMSNAQFLMCLQCKRDHTKCAGTQQNLQTNICIAQRLKSACTICLEGLLGVDIIWVAMNPLFLAGDRAVNEGSNLTAPTRKADTRLRLAYALSTDVPRDTGCYAEKLYVMLRRQFPGKSVPDGLQKRPRSLGSCGLFLCGMCVILLFFMPVGLSFEPRHDKTNKVTARPANTQKSAWASAQSDQSLRCALYG